MPGLSSRGIFLSYRRADGQNGARLLEELLSKRIPDASVFMDQDDIEPGRDYIEVIRENLRSCAVLLAVIGPRWATLTDAEDRRRLDIPGDLVCFEIQTALERGIPVIPVLVDGALMPRPEQLPAELQKLAQTQAQELSSGRSYKYDAVELVDSIQSLLAAAFGTGTGEQSLPTANAEALTDPYDVRPNGNALLTDAERTAQYPRIGGNTPLGGASLRDLEGLPGVDALEAQVRQTEAAAAQAQLEELQIDSAVAQAERKMKTGGRIFKGFDEVISG